MATQTELRDAVVGALKAQEDGLLAIGRASGRTQALASLPKSDDVLGAADALTSLMDALKGVGATDEAAKADRALAVLRQVAKALATATPVVVQAPAAPALTGLAALGKAIPNGIGATVTPGTTAPASAPIPSRSASPASEPLRVEPTGPNHASDSEVDERLAKFHGYRANYLTPEGKPRVPARVAKMDEWFSALVQGIAPTPYVTPEGGAEWPKADEMLTKITKLFD